jgi:hypothetical protein
LQEVACLNRIAQDLFKKGVMPHGRHFGGCAPAASVHRFPIERCQWGQNSAEKPATPCLFGVIREGLFSRLHYVID